MNNISRVGRQALPGLTRSTNCLFLNNFDGINMRISVDRFTIETAIVIQQIYDYSTVLALII